MNILLLNSWYFPNLKGGAEHSVKLLSEALVKKGHRVAVFTIDNDNRSLFKESINGVEVYRGSGGVYNIRKAYRKNKSILEVIKNKILEIRNYSVVDELSQVYQSFHPHVVHINCIAGMSMAVAFYFHLKKVPIVYTLRDYFLYHPKNVTVDMTKMDILTRFVLKTYQKYARNKSLLVTAVTAPSNFTLKFYLDNKYFSHAKYKQRIVNSVNVSIKETTACIAAKASHITRNFMYAGSLTKNKGIIPMLKAFMATDINTKLYICGDGQLSDYIENCAKIDKRIIVMGRLSSIELSNIYKESDIMLVPSLWAEPFGRVVIEAAQYGLYVIGSKHGGIPEIISELGCGEICDVENIEIFSETIKRVYYCSTFSETFHNIITNIKKYSIDKQVNDFELLYSEVQKTYEYDSEKDTSAM